MQLRGAQNLSSSRARSPLDERAPPRAELPSPLDVVRYHGGEAPLTVNSKMGGMLDKPNTEKHTDKGEGKLGDGTPYAYGASAM